jgi:hypothetical protein
MATMPELIYCANGNKKFAEIAIGAGFTYGAQLPRNVYFKPEFADQNWKKPNRKGYVNALKKHRPRMATVLDWEREDQREEVLAWAEEIAPIVETVIVVPKVHGTIATLPRKIGNANVRLGYSVPTKHGGTEVMAFEFLGWPIHLLGGSPAAQMKIAKSGLDVQSVDGNMHMKMANRCSLWVPGKKPFRNFWPTILQTDGEKWGDDAPYEAFRRSCNNIRDAWKSLYN